MAVTERVSPAAMGGASRQTNLRRASSSTLLRVWLRCADAGEHSTSMLKQQRMAGKIEIGYEKTTNLPVWVEDSADRQAIRKIGPTAASIQEFKKY